MKKIIQSMACWLLSISLIASLAGCDLGMGSSDSSGKGSGGLIIDTTPDDTTPDDSTPNDTTPDGSTPDDSTPDDSTPDDSTPDGSTPDDSTPDDTTPDDSTPDDSTPDDSTPDDSTPDDSTPDDSTPDDTTPDDSTPDDSTPDDSTPDDPTPDDGTQEEKLENLSFHFLELGNKYTGDCTYIKAGDADILIDAGSRQASAETIHNYVSDYCEDGKLEYVIATHADQDHISGFVGKNNQGIFDLYNVGTLIDFPLSSKTTQIYNNYKTKRENLIASGTKHYTALEWWNGKDGLSRSIEIADGITMSVLYQKYYETKTSNENNYSVCVMFSQGENHYLFTGDLEKSGEESLVQNNNLPKVKLYKAGHHGSATSSNTALMQVIQPEIVCVCCCANSNEYATTFPTQEFIDRVSPYTSQIYVTTIASNNTAGFESFNGNIVVSSVNGKVTVNCSNNNTILKETAWFKANRVWNGV